MAAQPLRGIVIVLVALGLLATTGSDDTSHKNYAKTLEKAQTLRKRAAADYARAGNDAARQQVLHEAREHIAALLTDEIIPAWFGTTWDFYGTSQTPGSGEIACGYFVSTVLRDAGFSVQRIKLAQQASEKIVTTLSQPADIRRLRNPSREEVLEAVRAMGDGMYVVGLDFHVGFLVKDGKRLDFCHSSYVDPPLGVVCQDAGTDPGLASDYYVLGRILSDEMMRAWLTKQPIHVQ